MLGGGMIVAIERTSDEPSHDQLMLEFFAEVFSQDGFTYEVDVPYPITDADSVSCMECITIGVGCTGDLANSGDCEANYAADAGELTITELDADAGIFKATLTGAQFINLADPNSGWCVDSYEFNALPAPTE